MDCRKFKKWYSWTNFDLYVVLISNENFCSSDSPVIQSETASICFYRLNSDLRSRSASSPAPRLGKNLHPWKKNNRMNLVEPNRFLLMLPKYEQIRAHAEHRKQTPDQVQCTAEILINPCCTCCNPFSSQKRTVWAVRGTPTSSGEEGRRKKSASKWESGVGQRKKCSGLSSCRLKDEPLQDTLQATNASRTQEADIWNSGRARQHTQIEGLAWALTLTCTPNSAWVCLRVFVQSGCPLGT